MHDSFVRLKQGVDASEFECLYCSSGRSAKGQGHWPLETYIVGNLMESPPLCEVSWSLIRVWSAFDMSWCHQIFEGGGGQNEVAECTGKRLEFWESSSPAAVENSCNSPVVQLKIPQIPGGGWQLDCCQEPQLMVSCWSSDTPWCIMMHLHGAWSRHPDCAEWPLSDFLLSLWFLSLSEAQCQKDTSAKCEVVASNHGLR